MVLLALPRADHLLIERDRGQFAPSRRRRMMANVRAEQPSAELPIPNAAAAQPRIVSKAKIRLNSRKSVRSFKGIICVDISEFESYMPSHAVRSLSDVTGCRLMAHRVISLRRQIGCCGQLLLAQTVRFCIRVIWRWCNRPLDRGHGETARLKLTIISQPSADYPTVAYTLDGQHWAART
jgi:hypothetical protein